MGYQNITFAPIRNQKSLITILGFNYMFIKNFNTFLENILNEIFAASKNCITKFIMYTLPVREIENQEGWTSTQFSYLLTNFIIHLVLQVEGSYKRIAERATQIDTCWSLSVIDVIPEPF